MTYHYELGGSNVTRWMSCAASVDLSRQVPKQPAGQSAIDGTRRHEYMERTVEVLLNGGDTLSTTNLDDWFNALPQEAHGDKLIDDACGAMVELLDTASFTNVRLEETMVYEKDLSGGTADFIAWDETNKILTVLDYKFGRIGVPAKSMQNVFYALCAVKLYGYEPEILESVIIQPAVHGASPDVHQYAWWEVMEIKTEIDGAINLINSPDTYDRHPPVRGDHCTWCPAQAICPAKRTLINALTSNPNAFTISENLTLIPELKAWIEATEKTALEILKRGEHIPNHKLVAKHGRKTWTADKDMVADVLMRCDVEPYKKDLVSPTQALKLVGDDTESLDLLNSLYEVKSSGVTYAPDNDKRERVNLLTLEA